MLDTILTPLFIGALVAKVLLYALTLRLTTLIVVGSPSTWLSTAIAAVALPILSFFLGILAVTKLGVPLMQLLAAAGLGVVSILAVPALFLAVYVILINLLLRTENGAGAPGFGPSIVIAIGISIVGKLVEFVASRLAGAIAVLLT